MWEWQHHCLLSIFRIQGLRNWQESPTTAASATRRPETKPAHFWQPHHTWKQEVNQVTECTKRQKMQAYLLPYFIHFLPFLWSVQLNYLKSKICQTSKPWMFLIGRIFGLEMMVVCLWLMYVMNEILLCATAGQWDPTSTDFDRTDEKQSQDALKFSKWN